jgi:ABC-type transport system involved in cytochrome c biogenesis permease component
VNTAVWALEWKQALRRRRILVFSAGVPLLLVAAVALGGAPAPHAALVYTVLFTFFGMFGAAIPWARDAERGWIHRLALTGVGMHVIAVERLLAGALVDLIELVPSLIVIAIVYRIDPAPAGWLALAVLAGLLTANAVGILVATVAASLAETALLAAVTALLLLHAGGTFRTPAPGSAAEALQHAVPFHYMNQAIRIAVRAP